MTIAVVHQSSDEGRAALASAAEEARVRGTDLLVLHVLSGGTGRCRGASGQRG